MKIIARMLFLLWHLEWISPIDGAMLVVKRPKESSKTEENSKIKIESFYCHGKDQDCNVIAEGAHLTGKWGWRMNFKKQINPSINDLLRPSSKQL